jgi:hypothetical protein
LISKLPTVARVHQKKCEPSCLLGTWYLTVFPKKLDTKLFIFTLKKKLFFSVLTIFFPIYSNVRGGRKLRSNFPTEREWVYNFANTEHRKWHIFWSKNGSELVVEIWTLIRSLRNFFFSVGNQKKLFHNFNTATHGGLKNIIFEIFYWQGATATCLQWVQKAPKNTFWGISPVSSVTISLNFFFWCLPTS